NREPETKRVRKNSHQQKSARTFRKRLLQVIRVQRPVWTDQILVRYTGWTCRHARETAETSVDRRPGLRGGQIAFEHFFHQVDPPARRIHFLTELPVRRAGRETKSAMNTRGNRLAHRLTKRADLFGIDLVQH